MAPYFSVASGRLALRWPDLSAQLNGCLLRSLCRCAQCRALQLQGRQYSAAAAVEIIAISPLNYGLQLHFDDGHARGIFPWSFLREIAEREATTLACI